MQPAKKLIVAIVVVVLIAVIGLVYANGNKEKASPEPTAAPVAAVTQEPTTAPVNTQEPEETEDPSTTQNDADKEAQDESAQEKMYEGALAGMTQEEIAKQALAEEEQEGTQSDD